MTPVIIAELGSSPSPDWNFDLWCLAAKRSGASHVKAQLFYAEHFPESEWAQKNLLEFPRDRLPEFVRSAHKYGLKAGASVFDVEAVRLVAGECDFIKLAAREQDNDYLNWQVNMSVVDRSIPVYRSMTDVNHINKYANHGQLITVSEYPAPIALSMITVARFAWCMQRLGLPWGYSSHTMGDADVRLAVRLGASAIEKHFCLAYTDLEGGHSLTPVKFRRMLERIG